jgi:hypothetical protein
MQTPEPSPANVREFCDLLLDGELSCEAREQLEALILGNPTARREYVERMHLAATLRHGSPAAGAVAPGALESVLAAFPRPEEDALPAWNWPSWPLGLAAGIILAMLLFQGFDGRGTAPIALLESVEGARWESSSLPTEPGSELRAGRLRLAEGLARVVFKSGAQISLEGPAELEITGRNACFLHRGALVAHVPESAKGFIVATAHAQLIDHGTEFGISADASGRAQVQVMDGEVEVRHARSGETVRLLSQAGAVVLPERLDSPHRTITEPDLNAFERAGDAPLSMGLRLSTAVGRGGAAYVVSPDSPLHHSDTLLLLKNTGETQYQRKAVLRFDLAGAAKQQIESASLTLHFAPTGFGYLSFSSECTFAVYGVMDDAQDDWDPDTVAWSTAPAFHKDAGRVDERVARKLGSFTLAKGVVSGACTVATPELAEFLNADKNRRATLVVVRETVESHPQSVVHGFAGNRHPALPPPTLHLAMAEVR